MWNQKAVKNSEEENIQKNKQEGEQEKGAQKRRDGNQTDEGAQGERTSGVQRAV